LPLAAEAVAPDDRERPTDEGVARMRDGDGAECRAIDSLVVIVHIASRAEWRRAQRDGVYRGDTLASQGFVHCSHPHQVTRVADALFRGRGDLVLLLVDEARVSPEVKREPAPNGELFPHLYGPLNLDAVVGVVDFPPRPDGTFELPAGVG
jgi:uncharacterized protein (DUF952 family)